MGSQKEEIGGIEAEVIYMIIGIVLGLIVVGICVHSFCIKNKDKVQIEPLQHVELR